MQHDRHPRIQEAVSDRRHLAIRKTEVENGGVQVMEGVENVHGFFDAVAWPNNPTAAVLNDADKAKAIRVSSSTMRMEA